MATIANGQKLYKVFKGLSGRYYKLVYIQGGVFDLTYPLLTDGTGGTTATKDVEFPDYVILNELEGEKGYIDDLPWGMPKMETLKLKLWMPGFDSKYVSDPTYTNWDSIRQSIKNRRSASTKSVNGVDIYIPNVWAVLGSSDGGSTYTTIESLTLQDVTPEKDYDFDEETYEITGVDLILSAFKQVTYEIISDNIGAVGTIPQNAYIQKWVYSGNNYIVGHIGSYFASDYRFKINNITGIEGYVIQTLVETVIRAYMRDITQNINVYRSPLEHLTLYTQDTTDANANKLAAIASDNDFYLIVFFEAYIDAAYEAIDGLFYNGSGENFQSFNNAFNIWKYFSEYFLSHVSIGRSGTTFEYMYQRLFDYRDNAGSTVTPTSIALADILNTPKMKEAYKIVKGGITYLENVGSEDINEYTYDLNSSQSEQQAETKPLVHNHPIWEADGKNTWNYSNAGILTETPLMKAIYYLDGSDLIKVHDYVDVNIGTGENITSGTQLGTLTNQNFFRSFVISRLSNSGFGYVFAQAAAKSFGSEYQFLLEFDVEDTTLNINDVGKSVSIDIGTFVSSDYLTPPHGTAGKLTNVKIDYINSVSNCKAFMYDPELEP